MNKYKIVEESYELWGANAEGLSMAISDVRMDDINAGGQLNKLLKLAEDAAYEGDIDYARDLLYKAYDEASNPSHQEWIQALLDLIFNIEQYL